MLWGSNAREAHPIWFHHLLKGIHGGTRLYVMDPRNPASKRRVAEVKGGGWGIFAIAPGNRTAIASEYRSITDTKLYNVDLASGAMTARVPSTSIASSTACTAAGVTDATSCTTGGCVERTERVRENDTPAWASTASAASITSTGVR